MTSDTRPGPHRHKCVECGEWLIDPAFLERLHEGELALTRHEKDDQIARLSEALRPFIEGTDDLETARHEAKRALASQPDIAARPEPVCDCGLLGVHAPECSISVYAPDIAAGAPTE